MVAAVSVLGERSEGLKGKSGSSAWSPNAGTPVSNMEPVWLQGQGESATSFPLMATGGSADIYQPREVRQVADCCSAG